MKAVTFNIRCDYRQDGKNNFSNRKALILKKMKEERPELIGFQEVLPHVADWLKDNLDGYYVIGCGRETDLRGEQVSIAYRRDRLNLIAMDTFWLSETPRVPGSRYREQSICPRTCTEAVFEEMETKRVFRVINTHLDHEGAGARRLALVQIMEHLEKKKDFGELPVLLMGDFNASPDSEELKVMEQYPQYRNITAGIGITFHNYGKASETIDYIYAKGFPGRASVRKWTEQEDGIYLSDHYPICAELEAF